MGCGCGLYVFPSGQAIFKYAVLSGGDWELVYATDRYSMQCEMRGMQQSTVYAIECNR